MGQSQSVMSVYVFVSPAKYWHELYKNSHHSAQK